RGEPIITASAPQAMALAMSPPVRMPPSATTWQYRPVSRWCSERAAAASAMAVAWGTPTPMTPLVVQALPGPPPTPPPRPGPQEMERGRVRPPPADDHGEVEPRDELLQVERL